VDKRPGSRAENSAKDSAKPKRGNPDKIRAYSSHRLLTGSGYYGSRGFPLQAHSQFHYQDRSSFAEGDGRVQSAGDGLAAHRL